MSSSVCTRNAIPDALRYHLSQLYSAKFMVSSYQLLPFLSVMNEIKNEYAENPDVFRHLIGLLYQIDTDTPEGMLKYPVIKKRIRYLLKEQTILADNLMYIIYQTFDLKTGVFAFKPLNNGLDQNQRKRNLEETLETSKRSKQQKRQVSFYNYCKPAVSAYMAAYGVPSKFTESMKTQSPKEPENQHSDSNLASLLQSESKHLLKKPEFSKSRQLYDKIPSSPHMSAEHTSETSCSDSLDSVSVTMNTRRLKEKQKELLQKLNTLQQKAFTSDNVSELEYMAVDDEGKNLTSDSEDNQDNEECRKRTPNVSRSDHEDEPNSGDDSYTTSSMEPCVMLEKLNLDMGEATRALSNGSRTALCDGKPVSLQFKMNSAFPYSQRVIISNGEIENSDIPQSDDESSSNDAKSSDNSYSMYGVMEAAPLACLRRVPTIFNYSSTNDSIVQSVEKTNSSEESLYLTNTLSDSEYNNLIVQGGGTSDHSIDESLISESDTRIDTILSKQPPLESYFEKLIRNALPPTPVLEEPIRPPCKPKSAVRRGRPRRNPKTK